MAARETNPSVWPIMALRGLAALLFGLGTVFWLLWPSYSLVLLFGIYALVDGSLALVGAVRAEARTPRWPLLSEGLVGVGTALLAVLLQPLWGMVLPLLVSGWAVTTGALKVLEAARLREDSRRKGVLSIAGAGSVAVGLFLLATPFLIPYQFPYTLALFWLIAAYALGLGIVLLACCRFSIRYECR